MYIKLSVVVVGGVILTIAFLNLGHTSKYYIYSLILSQLIGILYTFINWNRNKTTIKPKITYLILPIIMISLIGLGIFCIYFDIKLNVGGLN